ncbi:MAG: methyl-accepting chemotaxis protein [Candidatus Sulfotelmatobacter sp.]
MRWLNNLKVSRKLGSGFGMVLLAMTGLGLFSLRQLGEVNSATVELATSWMPSIEALANIRFDTITLKRRELNLLLADKNKIDSWKENIKIVDGNLAEDFRKYEPLISSDEERKLYAEYRADLAEYESSRAQVVKFAEKEQHSKAIELSQGNAQVAMDAALDKIGEDIQLNVKGGKAAQQTAAIAYAACRSWVAGILITGVMLGMVSLIIITRSIATPVHKTMTVLKSLAERDLTHTLDIDTTDELGVMAGALNQTIEVFRSTLATITQSAEQLASASEEIPAGAGQTAESARVQSDQTTQAATAMQEMSSTVLQISDNSQKASEASRNAAEAARKGGKVVEETLSTMQGIAESTGKVASTITELGKSSEQIGKIISVIDDIADQTNLLALNAAIEAARAGEQGRGFAVVADEVRKLAERTTKATKEIARMIESIQKETQNAVQAMERESKEVHVGVEKTSASGAALQEIITMSEQVGDMIATIATAATEQSATTEEINTNVSQISSSTQESSAASEQTAKACTELSSLAFDLQNLVSQFKLESGFQAANPPQRAVPDRAWKTSQSKTAAASAGA